MAKSIADELKQCVKELTDLQIKDIEVIFYSGVLLGLNYGTKGKEEAVIRILEIEKKLKESSVL